MTSADARGRPPLTSDQSCADCALRRAMPNARVSEYVGSVDDIGTSAECDEDRPADCERGRSRAEAQCEHHCPAEHGVNPTFVSPAAI
jgi:hypothetical protein